jgi:carbon monoxide dehydrogenase subunit G
MLHAAVMPANRSRLRAVLALAVCTAALSAATAAAQQPTVETYRRGDAVTVWAGVELQVDPRVAWIVLSDYDHFSQFIPDMSVSRVLSRSGDTTIVEQKGEFAFFFFRQNVELTLEIVETPPSRIIARAIGGSFREMAGRYDLEDLGGRVRISYSGRFVPDFPLPPFFGIVAVRHAAATQFTAMVEEIRRRDARAKSAGGR